MSPVIQAPEVARRLAKYFNLKGMLIAPELDYTIAPVVIVDDIREPDPFRGGLVRHYAIYDSEPATPGQFAHSLLYNPAGSGVLVTVIAVSFTFINANVEIGRRDDLTSFSVKGRGYQTSGPSSAGVGDSAALIYSRDGTRSAPIESWWSGAPVTNTNAPCSGIPRGRWNLFPGSGLLLVPEAGTGARLDVNYEWDEEALPVG